MDINTFNNARAIRSAIENWQKEAAELKELNERGMQDVLFGDLLNLSKTAIAALIESLEKQFEKL